MAAIKINSSVRSARVFAPKEEGWSETVAIVMADEFDGYQFSEETGEKMLVQTNQVSVFISEIIKVLSLNADLSAFLTAKTREERVQLLPVLMAGSKIKMSREHLEDEKKFITVIEEIVVSDVMMARVQKALDQLFGF